MARPKKKLEPVETSPELMNEIREQLKKEILQELKGEQDKKEAQAEKARTEGGAIRAKFVEKMKTSPEPWVDIIMWTETPTGVKYELDWNNAFIKHLEDNGVKGVDEDQTVQKWVAILLRSSVDDMESKLTPNDESKFE
jgi:hypothetical protein